LFKADACIVIDVVFVKPKRAWQSVKGEVVIASKPNIMTRNIAQHWLAILIRNNKMTYSGVKLELTNLPFSRAISMGSHAVQSPIRRI
jgi:hypothetical protein